MQVGVKEAKLRAKQAQEMEVLQGRGARGRDQLKRAHAQVTTLHHIQFNTYCCMSVLATDCCLIDLHHKTVLAWQMP